MRVHTPTMITADDPEYQFWGKSIHEYEANRNTPFVARSSTSYTLYRGVNCISLNMGMDIRSLLPPFSPLYRSQDAVFGYMLARSSAKMLAGFVPLIVEHKRNELRESHTDAVRTFTTVGKMTIHALNRIIRREEDGNNEAAILSHLGQDLMTALEKEPENMKRAVMEETIARLAAYAEYSKMLLAEHTEGPEYWKQDMLAATASVESAVRNIEAAPMFWDVGEWQRGEAFAWHAFLEWMKKYAAVLEEWPELFERALKRN